MADTKTSALTDGTTANSTDRLPAARTTDGGITWSNVYVTPGYIKTATIGAGSVSIASGKTFTSSNTLTLAGTDGTTMTFPTTSATIARTDAGNTFTGNQVITEAVGGSGLTITGATQATSQPVLNLTQTWDAGAVTFTGLKFNVTNTASAALSLALDIEKGGTTQAAFGWYYANMVSPALWLTNAAPTTANYTLLNISNSLYINAVSSSGAIWNSVGDVALTYADQNTFSLRSTIKLGWGSGNPSSAPDLILSRAAAATLQLGAVDTSATATVTITIATPGVVTWSSHGLSTGTPVVFSTTGALPTGITAGTTYYVIAVNTNTFQIATSYANATAVSPTAVATSGSQSGTHTGTRGAVDQVFRVQSASGTSNFPGADFTIQGSQGTGTGAGGSIIFQVAPAGSSGTAQNSYISPLQVLGTGGITGVDGATANTLALRNSTNAQTFNLYSTYTDASTNEYLSISYSSGLLGFTLYPTRTGSGSFRSLYLGTGTSTASVYIRTNGLGNAGWRFAGSSADQSLLAEADNAYDIGASGTTSRVRTIYSGGGYSAAAPTIKTADYSQGIHDYSLIFNGTGSITLTLLAAATYPGKILYVKTIAAQTVVSASSNVKPIDTDTAGTAILAATAGKWAMLQSDGTNWVIMAQG